VCAVEEERGGEYEEDGGDDGEEEGCVAMSGMSVTEDVLREGNVQRRKKARFRQHGIQDALFLPLGNHQSPLPLPINLQFSIIGRLINPLIIRMQRRIISVIDLAVFVFVQVEDECRREGECYIHERKGEG
jgi:hypothetical protein